MARGRRPGSSIGGIVLEKGGPGISLMESGGAESASRRGYVNIDEGGEANKGGVRKEAESRERRGREGS